MPSWTKLAKPLAQSTGGLFEQMNLANRVRALSGGPSDADLQRFGPEIEFEKFYRKLSSDEYDQYGEMFKGEHEFDDQYTDLMSRAQRYLDKYHPGIKVVPDRYYNPVTLNEPGVHHSLGKRHDFMKKSQTYDTDNPIAREHYFATHARELEHERRLIQLLRGAGYNPKRNEVSDPFGYNKPDINLMYQIYNAYSNVPKPEITNLVNRHSLPPGLWLFRGDPGYNPSITRKRDTIELTRPASFSTDPLNAFRPPSGSYYALRLSDRVRGARNFRNPEEAEAILAPFKGKIIDTPYIPDFPMKNIFFGDVEGNLDLDFTRR